MSNLRTAIVLLACLLLVLCVLFPAGIPADSWFPGFGWLPDVNLPVNAAGEHFEIIWTWVAEEMAFCLLATGIVWIGVGMERHRAIRFFLLALFLTIIAIPVALWMLRWGDLSASLFMVDVTLLFALLNGLYPAGSTGRAQSLKLGARGRTAGPSQE